MRRGNPGRATAGTSRESPATTPGGARPAGPPRARRGNAGGPPPGPPTQPAFTVQPANPGAGAAISPAVQVTALDAAGNPVPGYSGNVTVTLGNNPGGSTLGGTTAVATVNGVATAVEPPSVLPPGL